MISGPDHGASFITANAGYDYTFRNGLYCLLEYFYNGNALTNNKALSHVHEDFRHGL